MGNNKSSQESDDTLDPEFPSSDLGLNDLISFKSPVPTRRGDKFVDLPALDTTKKRPEGGFVALPSENTESEFLPLLSEMHSGAQERNDIIVCHSTNVEKHTEYCEGRCKDVHDQKNWVNRMLFCCLRWFKYTHEAYAACILRPCLWFFHALQRIIMIFDQITDIQLVIILNNKQDQWWFATACILVVTPYVVGWNLFQKLIYSEYYDRKTHGPCLTVLALLYIFPITGVIMYFVADTLHLLLGMFGHGISICRYKDPDTYWPKSFLDKLGLKGNENLHNGIENYRILLGVFLESTSQGVFTAYLLGSGFFSGSDYSVAVTSVCFSFSNVLFNLLMIIYEARDENVGWVKYIFYRMQFPQVTMPAYLPGIFHIQKGSIDQINFIHHQFRGAELGELAKALSDPDCKIQHIRICAQSLSNLSKQDTEFFARVLSEKNKIYRPDNGFAEFDSQRMGLLQMDRDMNVRLLDLNGEMYQAGVRNGWKVHQMFVDDVFLDSRFKSHRKKMRDLLENVGSKSCKLEILFECDLEVHWIHEKVIDKEGKFWTNELDADGNEIVSYKEFVEKCLAVAKESRGLSTIEQVSQDVQDRVKYSAASLYYHLTEESTGPDELYRVDFHNWTSKVFRTKNVNGRITHVDDDYYWCNILDISFPFHYAIEMLAKHKNAPRYKNMFWFCASQKSYYKVNTDKQETPWMAAVRCGIDIEYWDALFPLFFSIEEMFHNFTYTNDQGETIIHYLEDMLVNQKDSSAKMVGIFFKFLHNDVDIPNLLNKCCANTDKKILDTILGGLKIHVAKNKEDVDEDDEVNQTPAKQDNQKVRLAFVGNRGSGKTTLIRALRYTAFQEGDQKSSFFAEEKKNNSVSKQIQEKLVRLWVKRVVDKCLRHCNFELLNKQKMKKKFAKRLQDPGMNIDNLSVKVQEARKALTWFMDYTEKNIYTKDWKRYGKEYYKDFHANLSIIYKLPSVKEIMLEVQDEFPNVMYFFERSNRERILKPDYEATAEDIIRFGGKTDHSKKKVMRLKGPIKEIKFYDTVSLSSAERCDDWAELIQKMAQNNGIVIFCVDVCGYDVVSRNRDIRGHVKMFAAIHRFQEVVELCQKDNVQCFLVFTRMDKFKEKLNSSALGKRFHKFHVDSSITNDSAAYIKRAQRFLKETFLEDIDDEYRDTIKVIYTDATDLGALDESQQWTNDFKKKLLEKLNVKTHINEDAAEKKIEQLVKLLDERQRRKKDFPTNSIEDEDDRRKSKELQLLEFDARIGTDRQPERMKSLRSSRVILPLKEQPSLLRPSSRKRNKNVMGLYSRMETSQQSTMIP